VRTKTLYKLLQVKRDYGKMLGPVEGERREPQPTAGILFIWGCRVSTGGQIGELQAEVPVRTLVKQPAKQ